MPRDSISLDELVSIARTDSPTEHLNIKVHPRDLKQIEVFIADKELKHGKRKVHNLVVYSVYKDWAKEEAISLSEFNKSFSHYFPKKKNTINNTVYHLILRYKGGKFDTSGKHLKELRELYGKKAKKDNKEKPEQVSGLGQESEPNQSS